MSLPTEMRRGHPVIQEAFDSLEQLGIIAKTGEIRDGQTVYAITTFGKLLPDDPDEFEAIMADLDQEIKATN